MKKLFYFVIITGIVYVSAVFVSEIPRKAAFQVQANVARIAEIIILNNMCTPETVFSLFSIVRIRAGDWRYTYGQRTESLYHALVPV